MKMWTSLDAEVTEYQPQPECAIVSYTLDITDASLLCKHFTIRQVSLSRFAVIEEAWAIPLSTSKVRSKQKLIKEYLLLRPRDV